MYEYWYFSKIQVILFILEIITDEQVAVCNDKGRIY